jgi:hypothetical protein
VTYLQKYISAVKPELCKQYANHYRGNKFQASGTADFK